MVNCNNCKHCVDSLDVEIFCGKSGVYIEQRHQDNDCTEYKRRQNKNV